MRVRTILSKIIINACNTMEKNRENQWLPKLPRDSSYKTVRITNSRCNVSLLYLVTASVSDQCTEGLAVHPTSQFCEGKAFVRAYSY